MSDVFVRQVFDVVSVTSILVLLVLGMAVIVGMMGIFNLCQGELVLLGALTATASYEFTGNIITGVLAAPVLVGLFGLVLERTVVRRFYANPEGALLATFAVGLIIRELVQGRMTQQAAPVPAPLGGTVSVHGAQLSAWRMVIVVVTVALVAGLYFGFTRTRLGVMVRATLDNPDLAAASGVSTARVYGGTYAFGCALAGLAGAMIVPLQTLYPQLGFDYLVPMFVAVMIGGLGTFAGPVLGAAATAVPISVLAIHLSPATAQVIGVIAAIVVMRFRPQGILGRRGLVSGGRAFSRASGGAR